jgi:CheY-like chemotaxis protein
VNFVPDEKICHGHYAQRRAGENLAAIVLWPGWFGRKRSYTLQTESPGIVTKEPRRVCGGLAYDACMRLLLVEDEARIARFVSKGLREQSYAVDVATNGVDALYQAAINTYDLIVLDVMIPGRDGFAVCRELRASGLKIPILMLTAKDAVEDRIAGLDFGADDYLTKPFEFRELLARYGRCCDVRVSCGRRASQ